MIKKAIKTNDMNLLAQYRDSLYEHPRLTYLFFELTDASNLSCLHCGSSASPQNQTYLPKEAVKDVMDNVARKYSPHSIMICLTGGRAFAPYQNFMECIYESAPVKRTHECPKCKHIWETFEMIDDEDFCPKCGTRVAIVKEDGFY